MKVNHEHLPAVRMHVYRGGPTCFTIMRCDIEEADNSESRVVSQGNRHCIKQKWFTKQLAEPDVNAGHSARAIVIAVCLGSYSST